MRAYRLLSEACDYPLHLGVTEAGTKDNSNIKSSLGIGALLLDGIGDTLRVSIAARATEEKVEEVKTGYKILQALGLRRFGLEIVSCPTCGREDQGFDTTRVAREIERINAGLTHRSRSPSWAVTSTAPARPARPTWALWPAARRPRSSATAN